MIIVCLFDVEYCLLLLFWVYYWVDGFVYVNYVELVCKVCGVEMFVSFWIDFLMY